ncbi:hypothetical protein ROA7023_02235 [Roseisalinus antarcticus]|uniref:Uncharacterized protein n=1 Tax=Roseisalinus antarcticus TaxID=254357 RepID=A0A1Y5T311_9RHOB|nr:hypothetical protein ROA7023_02235 [Roseisalinus antarcticus]
MDLRLDATPAGGIRSIVAAGARPRYLDVRGASLRTTAPAVMVFHGLALAGREVGYERHRFERVSERSSVAPGDHVMTLARVAGAICRDAADCLVLRGPVQRVGQDRHIADVPPGDLDQRHQRARPNGGIAVGLPAATPACRHGMPAHLGAEPDRQRGREATRLSAFASVLEPMTHQWLTIGRPGPGPAGRGCRSAHTAQLPCWIHEMNPLRVGATEPQGRQTQ